MALNIWLITIGEQLIIDGPDVRLRRTSLLAEELLKLGHSITFFASSFEHYQKINRTNCNKLIKINNKYSIFLLRSKGYKTHLSYSRLIDHFQLGKSFKNAVKSFKSPDVIVCSFPPIYLSYCVTKFVIKSKIPLIIDARDLWPDMFFELIPRALYPLTKFMFLPLILQTKFSFRRANSIVGHTEEFVDWGLQYAGRRRTPFDKSFPMAYPEYSPNSTSLENFYNFWKKYDLAPGSDRIIISFVGTFGRAFDIETILKSASELKNIYPKLVFVLCGLGDRQSYYKNKAINMSNVIMPGFVNKNDLIALLKITSLGLAPYKNSVGFLYNIPNKPYEYMSESVPIATCLNGSLSKLILKYNCGQTYKEGDSSSLNRLIGKLVSEPKYFAELGKNGRIAYEIFFKSSTVYKAFANHIESIVTRFNT